MKRSLYILISFAIALQGCREVPADTMPDSRAVTVEARVQPDRMTTVSRAMDETAIRDLNLYLYDDNQEIVLHRYQTSPTLRFECLPGNYLMRVVANLGRNLGDSPAWDDFTVTHADEYDVLPMSYEGDITILPSYSGVLTLPAVEVRRCVAKVSYDINVRTSDIELQSIRLLSLPRYVSVFDVAAVPSDNPDDYIDGPETTLSGRQKAGNYYLLPNMQGMIPSITDQQDKNRDKAPANASYLLIRALRGSKVLAYYIFLGGNNTSDFNVRANVHYRLNISILGDGEVDTRVSSYGLNVNDTYTDNMIGGYCTYDVMGELFVEVDGDPAPLTLRGHITASQGDKERLLVDDASIGSGRDLELANQPGRNGYFLYYDFPVYTTANSQVAYTVTVEDDAGFAQSFDFRRRFANRLQVVVETADNGKGRVNVSQALYATEISGTRNHVVMCHEMGCTLVALPAAGYRFEGWYTTDGYTKRLSSSTTYLYIPESNDASIFPKFTASTRPLDDGGTANCYIAPELNTSYSFDATVMGNGRATTNIVPKKLAGAEAKVLWETGMTRGAIVESAELTGDGRIVFRTGMTCGNAVIGLLDSRGKCVWSWHIWSVDYDIEATAQTYASGAVFMDRNLGALTTDCTQAAAKGLYYQWGRKDPFMYPSTITQNSWNQKVQAPATYASGFEYDELSPRNEWDVVMTEEWAVAHPTTYIGPLLAEDWEGLPTIGDWLCEDNPNLWGNRTTTSIDKASSKSIYDPCPPGWRVPDLESFKGISYESCTEPYHATIRYRSGATTRIPLGGSYFEFYSRNGQEAMLYTTAPYDWEASRGYYYFTGNATKIVFRLQTTYIKPITTSNLFRYWAAPVRCIRE